MKTISFAALLLAVLVAYPAMAEETEAPNVEPALDSAEVVVDSVQATEGTPEIDSTPVIQERMKQIAKHVHSERDEFEGTVTYIHRHERACRTACSIAPQAFPARILPMIVYDEAGDAVRVSAVAVYHGKRWLMMNKVVFLVGEDRHQLTREDVLPGAHDASGSGVTELVVFPLVGPDARTAFEALAAADPKTVIKARFSGTQGTHDFKLDKSHREAWSEMLYYYGHFDQRPK